MMNAMISHKGETFFDEASLWGAFQQGDIRAFETIYVTHSSALLSYGKRLCADHDLVSDMVQDIFVEIWTRRSTLRDLHTIKYYLFKIMRNKLSKVQQTAMVPMGEGDSMDDLLTPSIEFLIMQQETNNIQLTQLQKAITQLPERQREAIMLAFYHNFSNDEIAGILNINHQSVINHLNRALGSLREVLFRLQAVLLLLVNVF